MRAGKIVTRLIGTARDITAVKKFESELQRQVAQRTLALQERTEQLEAFSYTVAHDLRSPLRSISGYANILASDFATAIGPEGTHFLEKIQKSAERMDALICDLLAFSRIMQMQLKNEPVSLEDVVHHVLGELRGEIHERHAEVVVDTALPVVLGERSVLEQIVLNLLTNALKFVAPGVAPRVTIKAREEGDMIIVRVTDNGIGIPAVYQDRIFRVFERLETSRQYPGTGVGLAIVAKAVERLGGRIGVESTPGTGSTFWFTLRKPIS
jgi:signal transduction histidine kinase